MSLGWPQVIYLILAIASLWFAIDEHGKPQTGRYNGWHKLAMVTTSLILLWCGGFFG